MDNSDKIEVYLEEQEMEKKLKKYTTRLALKIWLIWLAVAYTSASFIAWDINPYYWSGFLRGIFAISVFGWGLALFSSHDKAVENVKRRNRESRAPVQSKWAERLKEIQEQAKKPREGGIKP